MTPLARLVIKAVLPLTFLISVSHLVGAHKGPGDGFTAGIITSLGLTLQYIAFGYAQARQMLGGVKFQNILFAGLLVAVCASILPQLFGLPFLAIQEWTLAVPLAGDFKLTRAMLFDVGIYLVVVGGSMTAIDSLGRSVQ